MNSTSTNHEDLLKNFLTSADRLASVIKDLPEEGLDCRLSPESWSIRIIVHHLADDGDVWSMVIKKAVATPGTLVRFEGFPGNEPWADALDYASLEIQPSLSLIQSHRRQTAALLANNPAAWSRTVRLTGPRGENSQEMQVTEIIQMLTDHMLEHIREIEKIKASAAAD